MSAAILTGSISGAGLGTATGVPKDQVTDYERTAARHYIFDSGDAGCLRCLITGEQLTQFGGAPTFGANYVDIASAQGLMTGLADATAMCMALVVDYPAALRWLGGSYRTDTSKGWGAGIGAGATNEIRTQAQGTGVNIKDLNMPVTPTVGDKVFVAVSVNLDGITNSRRGLIASCGYLEDTSDTGSVSLGAAGGVGIGPGHSGQSGPLRVYEAMFWTAHQTFDFLGGTGLAQSAYARRKSILLARSGIVVR